MNKIHGGLVIKEPKHVPTGDDFCGFLPRQGSRCNKSSGICVTKISLDLKDVKQSL